MGKGKNFFFKIDPLQVLRKAAMEKDKEPWFLQFFEDLCNDDADLAVVPLAADIIREANEFRKKKSEGGKKGMENRWGKKDN